MPDVRHMDPSNSLLRRQQVVEERLRLVNDFCAACNRRTMVRLEGAFLEALGNWVSYVLCTTNSARCQLKEVERVIDRARELTDGKRKKIVVVLESKVKRQAVLRACKTNKHRLETKVDRKTLETFHFCVDCNAEIRLSPEADVL
jgi:hypothetical protein